MEIFRLKRDNERFGELLAASDAVVMRAYGISSRRERIERFIDVDGGAWFVGEADGRIIGVGGLIAYRDGGFGWIGLVATDPSVERQGIGRLITQRLIDELALRNCAAVLDASTAGAPLYARMGFVDHGMTAMVSVARVDGDSGLVSPVAGEDLNRVFAYDLSRFGASRQSLLNILMRGSDTHMFMSEVNGLVSGYVVCQPDQLGPFVADDEESMMQLLAMATSIKRAQPPTMIISADCRFTEQLRAIGCTELRVLRHQRLGISKLPGERGAIIGQTSFGEG